MYQASQVYIVGSWKHAPSVHISSVYASGLYIVETIVETKMKLNLIVDKNSRKVLYAEAGKNFVDFPLQSSYITRWDCYYAAYREGHDGLPG